MQSEEIKFLAMEYYWLILNRTFEIAVNQNGIHGAVVANLMSASSPRVFIAHKSGNAYDLVREDNVNRVRIYTAGSSLYLKLSSSNFSFDRKSILSIKYDSKSKWGMGPVPHTGKTYVTLSSGQIREFIILGRPDVQGIFQNMSRLGFTIQ
jgi:hypothetical protein